jgi:hypothetical protein
MQQNHFSKTLILTLVIVISFIASLEYYWRSKGFPISYNDDKVMWATQRKKIYTSKDEATVFIGGSRIKFDLDIATWQKETGEKAIQLALVGTPSRIILRNLANDNKFIGKLIIDVAEAQFFSTDTIRSDKSAREALEYYIKETPAQKASAYINHQLESDFVFLEEGKFGVSALLNELPIHNRTAIPVRTGPFKEFSITGSQRQSFMTPMFLKDTVLQNRMINIWAKSAALNKTPPINGAALESFLKEIKMYIDKIRARGGMVMFVRPPSSGSYIKRENLNYPRKLYWDHLLDYTHTAGIYFSDYPAFTNLVCLEESHLTPAGAAVFTKKLIEILETEKGWPFPNKNNTTAFNLKR